jgi:trigger factor
MEVRVRKEGPTKRVLELSLTPKEVEHHLDRVANEYQRRASLPGFRKGRAPRSVLEAQFGSSLQEEAVENAVNEAYSKAIQDEGLIPLTPPHVEKVHYSKGEPLQFEATVEVRPAIEARDYREVVIKRKVRELDEAAIDRTLERIREESAQLIDQDRESQVGDIVVIDHVRVDKKGRTLKSSRVRDAALEIDSEALLPEFKEALTGARAGESRTVEVNYPEDFSNKDLAGSSARFHIKVKKVQEKKLRDLDDNLAKELFDLGSLDELRSRIRLQMEAEERLSSRRDMEENLIEQLLELNEIPIPETLATRLTEDAIRRMGDPPPEMSEEERDEVHRRYRQSVERRIAREWLLDAIGTQESIEVPSEELAEEMKTLAQSKGKTGEDFRSLSAEERQRRVHDALLERKIFDFLIDAAKVEEERSRKTGRRSRRSPDHTEDIHGSGSHCRRTERSW